MCINEGSLRGPSTFGLRLAPGEKLPGEGDSIVMMGSVSGHLYEVTIRHILNQHEHTHEPGVMLLEVEGERAEIPFMKVLDEEGTALKDLVPSFVVRYLLSNFRSEKDITWWYLTEKQGPIGDLDICVGGRDGCVHFLPPESRCWILIESSLYLDCSYDPMIPLPTGETGWPKEAYLLEIEDVQLARTSKTEVQAVHITHYRIQE